MPESINEQIKHGLNEKENTRPHTALEHFIHLLVHPGRLLLSPFYSHLKKRYSKREKFEIKFLLIDIFLLLVALGVISLAVIWFIGHNKIENRIFFEATVAPSEIVSGAPSTLIIRYINGTGQELNNVYLNLAYPAHFQLQELVSGETPIANNTIAIGNLAPDAVGSVKIRGIMFGDVGGSQTFETKMSFTYGKKQHSGEKTARHVFSPTRSVLELSLKIPEKIIATQSFTGYIVYKNTGDFDLPEIIIRSPPVENFEFLSAFPTKQYLGGFWLQNNIKAGEEGQIEFTAWTNGKSDFINLTFDPYFSFADSEYKQKPLNQKISIIKPQLTLSHSVNANTAKPGGTLKTLVKYENTGDTPIYDVSIEISSESPFAISDKKTSTASAEAQRRQIGTILSHGTGEVEINTKLRSSIAQNATSIFEHLNVDTKISGSYKIEDSETAQLITISDDTINTPLTTPVTLNSFGRFSSERGDQLGRGPLPPIVGEVTKYWIFWHISGTTNELKNLNLSGVLPEGVEFTGRQTVSVGQPVTYNPTNKTVSWQAENISPTFSPTTKLIGVAFEVALTPTINQIGTSPTIISNVSLSGTDDWTGAWVTASGASVTTDLPDDSMASGFNLVVE